MTEEIGDDTIESVVTILQICGDYIPAWCRGFRLFGPTHLATEKSEEWRETLIVALPTSAGFGEIDLYIQEPWGLASDKMRVSGVLFWFLLDELARTSAPLLDAIKRISIVATNGYSNGNKDMELEWAETQVANALTWQAGWLSRRIGRHVSHRGGDSPN